MKNQAILFRVTLIVTIISLIVAICLHYSFADNSNPNFWCNVCLGIFGSGLLTCLSSVISYYSAKNSVLSSFYYSTNSLLKYLNKYSIDWDENQKIKFFLDYADIDKYTWDSQFGEIYFLCKHKEKMKYIHEHIYSPIQLFNQKVIEHTWHFRWYFDGKAKNNEVIKKFIDEIESKFMEIKTIEHIADDGQKVKGSFSRNILVHKTREELNGKYFDLINDKNGTWKVRLLPWRK